MRAILTLTAAVFGLAAGGARAGEAVSVDKLPKAVVKAVQKKYPKAELKKGSKETADGKTVYEVTATLEGKNLDMTLTEDGTITQVEREYPFDKLPKAVAAAFEAKHPKATYKIIEAVITVKDGKDTVEYYEAVVTATDKKTYEVEILPDGTFKGESEKK